METLAMPPSILSKASGRSTLLATLGALGVLAMTSIHHAYGAMVFDTPYRWHIVFISIPVGLAILASVPLARRGGGSLIGRVASWVYLSLVVLFVIAAIGIYEGGYNHLVPNIQYVLGLEHPLREDLYEPPDDLVFQLTGIAQFVLAVQTAWWLWKLVSSGQTVIVSNVRDTHG